MNQKSNQPKVLLFRLFVAMPLLLLTSIGSYMIFSNEPILLGEFVLLDADLPPIRLVEDASIDGVDKFATGNKLGDGVYALHAKSTRTDDFSFVNDDGFIPLNNSLNLNDEQDIVYVIFENFLPDLNRFEESPPVRESFILKVFYNFEQIAFRVSNQPAFQTEFLFDLKEGYQVQIPIQLPETIEATNELGNLTIGVFANPHYNTVNPLSEWYYYCENCSVEFGLDNYGVGIVSNFALSFEENTELLFDEQEPYLEETSLFFAVNPDFLNEHATGVLGSDPPSPWTVSRGEQVKIGFSVSNVSYLTNHVQAIDMDGFVIIGLLNWEQIELNKGDYFLESRANGIGIDEMVEDYFVITAPTESGYYDFVAFVIANPDEPNYFHNGSIAIRFTLKIE